MKLEKEDEILKEVRPEDLIRYGFIPELIGRLPVVSTINHLDESALMRVLIEPKNSLLEPVSYTHLTLPTIYSV